MTNLAKLETLHSSNLASRIRISVTIELKSKKVVQVRYHMALWSNGKHLASGSGGPGFESWLCQVDIESSLNAFPHPTHVYNKYPTMGSFLE